MVKHCLNPLFSLFTHLWGRTVGAICSPYSHPYVEALLETFVLLIHTLLVKHCLNPLFSLFTHLWWRTVGALFSPYSHPYVEALLEPFVLLIHNLMVKHWLFPLWKQLADHLTASERRTTSRLAGRRWTTEQRRLWRYTTRDDCVMQRGHDLCNHLQERKLKLNNSALSGTYRHPQKQWHYSSLFPRSKGHIFIMGRLCTPLGVLIVTTRTMPSLPGCMSVITAVGHWRGAVLAYLSRTKTPGCRLGDVLCQRWRCCRLWM